MHRCTLWFFFFTCRQKTQFDHRTYGGYIEPLSLPRVGRVPFIAMVTSLLRAVVTACLVQMLLADCVLNQGQPVLVPEGTFVCEPVTAGKSEHSLGSRFLQCQNSKFLAFECTGEMKFDVVTRACRNGPPRCSEEDNRKPAQTTQTETTTTDSPEPQPGSTEPFLRAQETTPQSPLSAVSFTSQTSPLVPSPSFPEMPTPSAFSLFSLLQSQPPAKESLPTQHAFLLPSLQAAAVPLPQKEGTQPSSVETTFFPAKQTPQAISSPSASNPSTMSSVSHSTVATPPPVTNPSITSPAQQTPPLSSVSHSNVATSQLLKTSPPVTNPSITSPAQQTSPLSSVSPSTVATPPPVTNPSITSPAQQTSPLSSVSHSNVATSQLLKTSPPVTNLSITSPAQQTSPLSSVSHSTVATPPPVTNPSITSPAQEIAQLFLSSPAQQTPPQQSSPTHEQSVSTTNSSVAKVCGPSTCKLPACFCIGSKPDLDPGKTPMMIMVTFDDAVTGAFMKAYYRDLLVDNKYSLQNPNKCPIKASFFVSTENTDYQVVKTLYAKGHEFASHTVHHILPDGGTKEEYREEIVGVRPKLEKEAGIDPSKVRGFRAPYLKLAGTNMFEILSEDKFLYDASVTNIERKKGKSHLWPYTLDFPIPKSMCPNGPCPEIGFPELWEVPINAWMTEDGGYCAMIDGCVIVNATDKEEEVKASYLRYFKKNFYEDFYPEKIPMNIFTHTALFMRSKGSFEALIEFLKEVIKLQNVWLLTPSQVIDWMRAPVSNDDAVKGGPASWTCETTKN